MLKQPKEIEEPFLRKKDLISIIKRLLKFHKNTEIKTELQEPLLFLMKNNGYTDIIEGVQPGPFIINAQGTEKQINLTPDRITTLKYGGQYWKVWIAYEDDASPYPQNPVHTAETFRKTTQKLSLNWRDKDEAAILRVKSKMWMYVIIGIVILGTLAMSFDWSQFQTPIQTTTPIIKETTTTIIQNATTGLRI